MLLVHGRATATATWDLSCVCNLHHSSRQHWILNQLSKARDPTHNLTVPSRIRFCCATTGTLFPSFLIIVNYKSKTCNFFKNQIIRIRQRGGKIGHSHPSTLLVGMYIGSVTMQYNMEVPQKLKNRTTMWSSISTPGYTSEGNKNSSLKIYVHPNVQSCIIYNSQYTEAN